MTTIGAVGLPLFQQYHSMRDGGVIRAQALRGFCFQPNRLRRNPQQPGHIIANGRGMRPDLRCRQHERGIHVSHDIARVFYPFLRLLQKDR